MFENKVISFGLGGSHCRCFNIMAKGLKPMKIVYSVCCGVDVHKRIIVATLALTDTNNITHYITESFSPINADLYRFRTWLLEHRCFNVCMESTGKYWIPVFNILEETGIKVLLTHPKYVRAI